MSKCPFHSGASEEQPPPGHPPVENADVNSSEPACPHLRKVAAEKKAASERAEPQCPHLRKLQADEDQAPAASSEPASWATATPEEFKDHFTKAYDAMSAHPKATKDKAHIASILMGYLGYTEEELAVIGDDVQLMQGTGNPHILAKIKAGETVVDLGSGFGIDAFVAAHKVGESGRVVGIDLAMNEVNAAIQRTSTRKLRNVDFRLGDIEAPPMADASVDCVISNGGFCLVPRKAVAFEEIFRMLKPGGRFSISCTTSTKDLDPSLDWPSCMVVFMPLRTVEEMLSKIGFVDIVIDTSNSSMTVWEDAKAKSEKPIDDDGAKITIHKGESRYAFLKNMDMNEFFARVNIYAAKP
ncbi:methyltransferase family 31, putative [Bodo saltans]|uniref:phosphoethanolamine N-methyltransferase n=1 Tax=Bodo saltans TaxID=75058 RepID=A0A0S4J0B1_BODSA|nr:methyltransferase family 31, putative [Bodo saltans]|eukprot:CUG30728.1 methyltransferase family 31, putative [Bodo saltans]